MTNGRPLMGERSVLAGLVLFGILAIVLGVGNFQRIIGGRSAGQRAVTTPNLPATTREEFERQQQAALAARDTDADGLSDFDELERTRTSPFLADSDSDGRSDKEEVDAGQDPNCPTGTTCAPVATGVNPTAIPRTTPAVLPGGGGASTPAMVSGRAEATGSMSDSGWTAAELRAALQREGISQEALDQIEDAQLTASFEAMLQSASTLPSGERSPFASTLRQALTTVIQGGGATPDSLVSALPSAPAEIRALLIQTGMPREQLAQIDDATLVRFWGQTLTGLVGNSPPSAGLPVGQGKAGRR